MNKILFTRMSTDTIIMMLRSFALILIVVISYLIYQNWQENLSLIGALGILISALIASFSVILNIDSTINLKNREISNQIRNTFFQLCLIKTSLISLENEKVREKITYLDLDRIFDSVEDIYKLLSELKSQDIVSIAHNDILTNVHNVYFHISTLHTHLRATRKNIIKPLPAKDSTPIYPNPMIKMDFKVDDMIKELTKILTYLKDSYDKDFKKDEKGIEACAGYWYGMTKMLDKEKNNE
ncbi:MAG: hypothetical protein WC665_12080 [Sulfurimonas sp.]